ncbi:hypothetical protein Y032_0656g1223 [Ancylostoma ceylanicum]|uniref:Uncharacterized protein n=1 Tax=Ancylostoma ceylanicum TaxID=53326 RepID=A0A016WK86_9BILA|nr:hypothetical protein Y032_0656g1223 [Ancylostoma ceylanicum]
MYLRSVPSNLHWGGGQPLGEICPFVQAPPIGSDALDNNANPRLSQHSMGSGCVFSTLLFTIHLYMLAKARPL